MTVESRNANDEELSSDVATGTEMKRDDVEEARDLPSKPPPDGTASKECIESGVAVMAISGR